MMNDNKTYLTIIALFSLILFVVLAAFVGTQDLVRDSLLSILTVSYIVNNLPSNKK